MLTINMTPVVSLLSGGHPYQDCINACMKCAQICQECFSMCLQEPDVKARANCMKTLQDCAEICAAAACFMARGSGSIKEICGVCATVCERCDIECGMFEDQHCKSCADMCRKCADECRNMAK